MNPLLTEPQGTDPEHDFYIERQVEMANEEADRMEAEVVRRVEKALRSHFDYIDIGQLHDDEEWTELASVATKEVLKMLDEGFFDE